VRRLLLLLGVLAVALVPGSPAWAHNQLAESVPAAGATLTAAPVTMSLRFRQKLDPRFTTIVLADAARQRVPTGAPVVVDATATVSIGAGLTNGGYTVAYRTVSVDGHVVQGSYAFTIAGPAPAVAPTAGSVSVVAPAASPAPPVAPAVAGPPERRSPALPIGLGAAAVVVAGAAVLVAIRRRVG
jgi:copper resistance protein C